MRSFALIAVAIAILTGSVRPSSGVEMTTKLLLLWCDSYIASGGTEESPGVLCAAWFEGWTASYRVGANGKQPDGRSVFGICEPAQFSPEMFIRAFDTFVHNYSK
jgi:hypothetical protein